MTRDLKIHIFYGSIILISFALCYYSTLNWMLGRFLGSDSYYSHGFIIPVVSGFLIWRKKDEFAAKVIEFSWWGLVVIIASVLLHIAGTVLYVFSVSGFSIFFLLLGMSLFLFGPNITKIILFPLVYLIFMFPLPEAFLSWISFPMKMLVSKFGVDIVNLFGIPVFREGFHISIANGNLVIGNPCSGLRSLIAFLSLSAVLAHLTNLSLARKWILLASAVPVAILSNLVRVPILVFITYFWGTSAAMPGSFWHDASGLVVFTVGLILIFLIGKLLGWKN